MSSAEAHRVLGMSERENETHKGFQIIPAPIRVHIQKKMELT